MPKVSWLTKKWSSQVVGKGKVTWKTKIGIFWEIPIPISVIQLTIAFVKKWNESNLSLKPNINLWIYWELWPKRSRTTPLGRETRGGRCQGGWTTRTRSDRRICTWNITAWNEIIGLMEQIMAATECELNWLNSCVCNSEFDKYLLRALEWVLIEYAKYISLEHAHLDIKIYSKHIQCHVSE